MPGLNWKWLGDKNRPKYTAVKDAESSSDVENELKGPNVRASSTFQSLFQHLMTFGLGVILASAFLLSSNAQNRRTSGSNTASEISLIKSPVPPIPNEIVTFERNQTFMARPTTETDIAWNHLIPPGRGWVYIPDPENYDLQPGQETQWGEIWSIAMFHQLHCLGMMRKAYWTLIKGVETGDTRKSKLLLTEHDGGHIGHCFDYLRQSIMCSGDMSVEWPRTEEDGRRIQVDGWGVPHVCKSWDAVIEYMDGAHFNNSWNVNIAD